MKIALCLALAVTAVLATQRRFDGYQVFTVVPKDRAQYDMLVTLQHESINYDFWREPLGLDIPVDIMVSPAYAKPFIQLMRAFKMEYTVKIDSIQGMIERERAMPVVSHPPRSSARYNHNWGSYSRLDTIYDFMYALADTFPNMVTVTVMGQSYEGRDMPMMKISTGGSGTKKAIFVDGGIHAREWVSPATVTWMMSELVERYDDHPEFVDNLDWYFMPVINPDGYEYSHTNDRLWRKSRKPNGGGCYGTDMNRNWGFHWNEGGSSSNRCSDTYHGGVAWSEIETQVVRDAMLSIGTNTAAYLTYHSYGQYLFTPWGYTSDLPDDYNELYAVGIEATNALTALYGTRYTVGSSTNLLYIASGGSDDWAHATVAEGGPNIKYSHCIELRDTGRYGFILPASQIIPTAEEMWEAVKVIANKAMTA